MPKACTYDAIGAFALTEPDFGSAATALRTTATKTEGGWILNGEKRWIGNAAIAEYIVVWARNKEDGNKIQGFVVINPSPGLTVSLIQGKMALRMVGNCDIKLDNLLINADADERAGQPKCVKICNFESSFKSGKPVPNSDQDWPVYPPNGGTKQFHAPERINGGAVR